MDTSESARNTPCHTALVAGQTIHKAVRIVVSSIGLHARDASSWTNHISDRSNTQLTCVASKAWQVRRHRLIDLRLESFCFTDKDEGSPEQGVGIFGVLG